MNFFKKLFGKDKKESQEHEIKEQKSAMIVNTEPAYKRTEQLEPKKDKGFVSIPNKIGDCIRVYYYPKVKFSPDSEAERLALEMQETGDWKVDLRHEDSKINVYYHDEFFGTVLEKEDMVIDWIKRDDPLFCILGNFGDSGYYLALAFYRDEQKRLSNRESSIIKLIRCTSEDSQMNMIGLQPGEKLDLEEDYEREDGVNVLANGCKIGALPKRQAIKYLEEGCAGVFLERMENDDNFHDIPYVKIYW